MKELNKKIKQIIKNNKIEVDIKKLYTYIIFNKINISKINKKLSIIFKNSKTFKNI